jgi:hypothetical protein
MATKTFSFRRENRRFSIPNYLKKHATSDPRFQTPEDLIDYVDDNIEVTWNAFAKSHRFPALTFRKVKEDGKIGFEANGRWRSYGGVAIQSYRPLFIYTEGSGKNMEFVRFLQLDLYAPDEARAVGVKEGFDTTIYDIIDNKWYTFSECLKVYQI